MGEMGVSRGALYNTQIYPGARRGHVVVHTTRLNEISRGYL